MLYFLPDKNTNKSLYDRPKKKIPAKFNNWQELHFTDILF